MGSLYNGFGAALKNAAAEVLRIGEAYGPIALVIRNIDDKELVLSVSRKSSGKLVLLQGDTAVTVHAIGTGYTGNTTDRDFTGQSLAHVPVIPGSVTVKPTAGGNSINSSDVDGDGKLYAYISSVKTLCGSVNYFTGLVDLHYPVGKAPNTGAITCDFSYSSGVVKSNGIKTFQVPYLSPKNFETLIVKVASKLGNARVRATGFLSF